MVAEQKSASRSGSSGGGSSSVEETWEKVTERVQSECAAQTQDFTHLMERVGHELTQYCEHRPKVVALGLIALGFIVGWRMKP
jgi:hypothetical protein